MFISNLLVVLKIKIMETKVSQISLKEIDQQNNKNWNRRYENPRDVIEQSEQLLVFADKISYKKGWYYAKLNIAASKFLLSDYDKNIVNDLYEIILYFEKLEPESVYVNTLSPGGQSMNT